MVRVYDFFSGCGGASCGFQSAGMEVAFAMDNDPDAKVTFEANFPDAHFELANIRKASPQAIRRRVKAEGSRPVLFSGCAPCQPFSKLTRGSLDQDERVPLLTYFARLVEVCRPDLVFMENVPGLRYLDAKDNPFADFISRLDGAGYKMDYRILTLKKYGVPQTRRRLVLVGSRHGEIYLPDETHGPGTSRRYTTVRDWISHFPPLQAGEADNKVANHRARNLSPRNIERIKATPEGGSGLDLPEHLKTPSLKNPNYRFLEKYGRMSWDSPGPTITTSCTSLGCGRFGHPEQHRSISVREAASLQTFPEDFVFKGSMTSMLRHIGNAVPVRLAELIGQRFIEHLQDPTMVTQQQINLFSPPGEEAEGCPRQEPDTS